jgi:hypothetical protein
MAVVAVLAWLALVLQGYLTISLSIANGNGVLAGVITFFSYFTILANLLVAMVLTCAVWAAHTRVGAFFSRPTVQSGTAVYIAIVGIVYILLLREIWNPLGWQKLADTLLHDVLPVLYVGYWLFCVRKRDLRWKDALWWLICPAIYFAYTLLRGAGSGSYPYPFFNVSELGYARVWLNAVMLLAAFLFCGLIAVAVGRLIPRPRRESQRSGSQ